jgi:hypothetical protein
MPFTPELLSEEALTFLAAPRVIGSLATTRTDGRPHIAAVGFTYAPERSLVSVVTKPGSQKVRNVEAGSTAVVNQINGMLWLQLAGPARVVHDAAALADAYERFAARYGRVHEGEELCVLEIAVDRCLGPENGWGRIGFDPTASVHH